MYRDGDIIPQFSSKHVWWSVAFMSANFVIKTEMPAAPAYGRTFPHPCRTDLSPPGTRVNKVSRTSKSPLKQLFFLGRHGQNEAVIRATLSRSICHLLHLSLSCDVTGSSFRGRGKSPNRHVHLQTELAKVCRIIASCNLRWILTLPKELVFFLQINGADNLKKKEVNIRFLVS